MRRLSLLLFLLLASSALALPKLWLKTTASDPEPSGPGAIVQDYFVEDHDVVGNSTAGTFDDTIGDANADDITLSLSGLRAESTTPPAHRQIVRFAGKEYPVGGAGETVGSAVLSTASSGTSNSLQTLVAGGDGAYVGRQILFTTGPLAGQKRTITAFDDVAEADPQVTPSTLTFSPSVTPDVTTESFNIFFNTYGLARSPGTYGGLIKGCGMGPVVLNGAPGADAREGCFTRLTYTGSSNPATPLCMIALQGRGMTVADLSICGSRTAPGSVFANLSGIAVYTPFSNSAGKDSCGPLSFSNLGTGIEMAEIGDVTGGNQDNCHWHNLNFSRVNKCIAVHGEQSMEHVFTGDLIVKEARRVMEHNYGGKTFFDHITCYSALPTGVGLGDDTLTVLWLDDHGSNGQMNINGVHFEDTLAENGILIDTKDNERHPVTISISNVNVQTDDYTGGFFCRMTGAKILTMYNAINIPASSFIFESDPSGPNEYSPRVLFVCCNFNEDVTILNDIVQSSTGDATNDHYIYCIGCTRGPRHETFVDQASYDSDGDGNLP